MRIRKEVWIIGIIAFLVGLDWYIRAPDTRSRQLTAAIEANASDKLKNYPYHFHVVKVVDGTAYVSTPRNVQVPAFKALAVIHPDVNTKDAENPAFIAAEHLLGEVQSEARTIVLAQPGIKAVRWELDRDWLAAHSIEVPD